MSRVRRPDQIDNTAGGRSGRRGAALWLRRCALGAVVIMMGQPQLQLRAQTNSAHADANRCLLIVDTSRAMERRSQAMLEVVRDLVMSGLNGQLRRGDTLGLWTFNQELYAGRLPLQVWSAEGRENIASRTIAFLRAQQYSKRASFDSVLPALDRVIKNSERITVVLISSGEERIQGTPFDNQIRDFYQRGRSPQRKAHMPFVTILRALPCPRSRRRVSRASPLNPARGVRLNRWSFPAKPGRCPDLRKHLRLGQSPCLSSARRWRLRRQRWIPTSLPRSRRPRSPLSLPTSRRQSRRR